MPSSSKNWMALAAGKRVSTPAMKARSPPWNLESEPSVLVRLQRPLPVASSFLPTRSLRSSSIDLGAARARR